MKTAILEILTENLPAGFVKPATEQMQVLCEQYLKENNLVFDTIKVFGTYKRLVLIAEGLPEKSADTELKVKGPPANLLKDEKGSYTEQALGFAKKHNLKPQDLTIVDTGKGKFLFAKKIVEGRKTKEILAGIFVQIMRNLTFPKTMFWEQSDFGFARPIRNILAMYGDKTVSFKLADVKSSNFTYGLSALGAPKIKIKNAASYEKILEKSDIILDSEKRKNKLLAELQKTWKEIEFKIPPNSQLIDEVLYLVENPVCLLCKFDKDFLKLPQKLITTVFAHHMKCFALTKNRRLAPHFIAVLDGIKKNHGQIKKGYQNVARARLADAKFFYEQDLKTGIEKMRQKLAGVLFNEKVGTMLDKTNRIKELSKLIAGGLTGNIKIDEKVLEKTASLCYADLTSQVVGEFPELQGYIGSIYAHDDQICKSLQEFYYPLTAEPNSPLPSALEGALVSLADKIDTLACNFALGFIPTGSEDPHGLRRQAMGVVRIIMEKGFKFGLGGVGFSYILGDSFNVLRENFKGNVDDEKLFKELENFLWHRFETLYRNEFKLDEFRAVKEVSKDGAFTDILNRLEALHNVRQDENFDALIIGFKRVANILRGIETQYSVNPALFKQEQEKKIFEETKKLQKVNADLVSNQNYETALKNLTHLKTFIDDFFDNVMVMAGDETLKQNRLALLQQLHKLFSEVADLSQLQSSTVIARE